MLTADRVAEQAVLEQNARNLRDSLLRRIHEYEARYELPSEHVEEALATGRLPETAEVSRWVIMWRTLRSLTAQADGRRPARVG